MKSLSEKRTSEDRSPYKRIVCPCGCEQSFRPKRSNQIYLNKKHADKAYYQNITKPQQVNENFYRRWLRSNDKICGKYFNFYSGETVICNLESLMIEGFDLRYFMRKVTLGIEEYHLCYNYMIHIFEENGIEKVKIRENV